MSNYLRQLSWWIFYYFSCWIFIFNSLTLPLWLQHHSNLSFMYATQFFLTLARHNASMCASLDSPSSISQSLGFSRCLFHLFHVYFKKTIYTNQLPMCLTTFLFSFFSFLVKLTIMFSPNSMIKLKFLYMYPTFTLWLHILPVQLIDNARCNPHLDWGWSIWLLC